jgi:hypothetical protein
VSNDKVSTINAASFEALESRARITDLVHRYANHIIAGTFQDCRALFTRDATFETRQGKPNDPSTLRTLNRAEGIDAILAYVGRSAGGVCPMIHNLVIDISGDEAVSSCVMAATVWATGQVIVGQYHDTYRRDPDWRFASRAYTMFRD